MIKPRKSQVNLERRDRDVSAESGSIPLTIIIEEGIQRPLTRVSGEIEERVPARNGNGGSVLTMWDRVAPTATLGGSTHFEATGVWTTLSTTAITLQELRNENARLTRVVEEWASERLDAEASAVTDECSIGILSRVAEGDGLAVADLGELLHSTEEWLAVVRLSQAHLVDYLGSYLYVTARGEQILSALFKTTKKGTKE